MEHHERKFKGVWIPKEIWDNTDLTWTEKCLLAEINCLDDEVNGCTASNAYLAEKFQTSSATIGNMLSKIKALGLIATVGFDGRRRVLRVKAALTQGLKLNNPGVTPALTQGLKLGDIPYIPENKEESKEAAQPLPSPTRQFTDGWNMAYKERFGEDYIFDKGKDPSAVKKLLTIASPDKLISVARKSLAQSNDGKHWACSNNNTIAFFASQWNNIVAELARNGDESKPTRYKGPNLDTYAH